MAINRGPFNALVDDDGTNTVGSVWNKSAIDSVILTPTDAELALKAPLASPVFSGTPAGPTPPAADSSTRFATTAFVQGSAPAWVPVAYNASNFVGTGGMTWTVDSGDQVRFSYLLDGKKMTVSFWLDSTTLAGTASTEVRLTIPLGKTSVQYQTGTFWRIAPSPTPGYIIAPMNQNYLQLLLPANYALGTNNTTLSGTFTFEIN